MRKLLFLFIFMLVLGGNPVFAQCEFSTEWIKPPVYDKKEFYYANWDNNKKIFLGLTKKNEYIRFQLFGCDHYGINIHYFKSGSDYFKNKKESVLKVFSMVKDSFFDEVFQALKDGLEKEEKDEYYFDSGHQGEYFLEFKGRVDYYSFNLAISFID